MSNDKNIKMIIDMIMDRINSHVKDITSERFYKQWINESNQETIVEELSSINFIELSKGDEDDESSVVGGEEKDENKIIEIFNTFKYEKRRELIKKLSDTIPDSNNNKKTKGQKNTRKKAVRKQKEKNKLKRPMSAYLLFCSNERAVIKEENPEMKSKDIMKETAIRWKRINAEDKQIYIKRNEELKIEYQEKKEQLKDEGEEEGEEGDEKKVQTRSRKSRNKKQKKGEDEEEGEDDQEEKKVTSRIRNKKQKKGEDEEEGEDDQEERNTPVKKTRKVSGYVLYCREVRNKFKEENPGVSGKEIVKLINNSWSELSKEEKNGYSK